MATNETKPTRDCPACAAMRDELSDIEAALTFWHGEPPMVLERVTHYHRMILSIRRLLARLEG